MILRLVGLGALAWGAHRAYRANEAKIPMDIAFKHWTIPIKTLEAQKAAGTGYGSGKAPAQKRLAKRRAPARDPDDVLEPNW
jgi:hypothetical protein